MPAQLENVKHAILDLLREKLLSAHELIRILQAVARTGVRRGQIIALVSEILYDPDHGLAEEEEDLLGDLALNLMGQCSLEQMVRFAGEPVDTEEFLAHVYKEAGIKRRGEE